MYSIGLGLKLRPGSYSGYKKAHDEIWPELVELTNSSGVQNYSIFLHGQTLFAYLETEDPEAIDTMKDNELTWKWWRYMQPLMECNEDASPVIEVIPQVFHMD